VVPAIRDAFGIGDAFLAGLIWGLLDSGVASDALRAGAALAALKSTIAGDFARFASQELVMAIAAPTGEIVR
jgi:sugar/nucleoside kinase (ribokinase family)